LHEHLELQLQVASHPASLPQLVKLEVLLVQILPSACEASQEQGHLAVGVPSDGLEPDPDAAVN
jgi:hypothetical protein